jgi:hypothetical protein
MAQNNVLVYSEHLFARKGEAAPAGRAGADSGHGCLSAFPHNGSKQPNSKQRKSGERGSSPLSNLIQRRPHAPGESGDADIAAVSENEVFASWRKLKSRLETPSEPEQKEQWKKLTFRVRHDQYMRLKNLSGLWGTTYQSILEKAVTYYIDEATTSEGSE